MSGNGGNSCEELGAVPGYGRGAGSHGDTLVGLAWDVTMDRGRWARGICFPVDCRYMVGVRRTRHVPKLVGGCPLQA